MIKLKTPNLINNYILSALAVAFVFFAVPVATEASETESKLLTEGIENNHVEQLQDLLLEEGYLQQNDISGVYDDQTSIAVKNYQEDHDLMVDGKAGVQTLGALKVLEEGDDHALVADLQETLQEQGYYDGSLDGHFDSETGESVKAFQSEAGIEVDGLAGPETFGVLYYGTSEETTDDADQAVEEKETVEEEATEEETTEEEATDAEASGDASASDDGSSDAEGETYTMEATAYTANCDGCSGVTATGIDLNNNRDANVVAVDPNVIPLGSTVHVEGYGEAVAGDTGGAINGEKIDLHVPTQDEALEFGRQDVEVTVLD
ncbi:peptidoglycan-binding protein [Salicibibacter halophilus]|uniref:Peptidoglycan-binding protein n=1 Tax=Salicibibacter halophilus TaxID=2502791 RepID=A0A514LIN2_9BACI|nr:peptidoglycan-binding protein [Salicibibacter halophilus]QDI91703.1 peptidoglycan-binding protein [Salicibibacter halophilus]